MVFVLKFGTEELLLYGTEEQKKRYFSPICEGDAIFGFAITESDAGSDTAAASTTPLKDGNDYVPNGSKVMNGKGTHILGSSSVKPGYAPKRFLF